MASRHVSNAIMRAASVVVESLERRQMLAYSTLELAPTPTESGNATAVPLTVVGTPEVVAKAGSGPSVRLSWPAVDGARHGYEIQRRVADGAYEFVARVNGVAARGRLGGRVSYVDLGLEADQGYTYRIRAVGLRSVRGEWSNPVSVLTSKKSQQLKPGRTAAMANAAAELGVVPTSGTSAKLSWSDLPAGATGYEIQRRQGDDVFAIVATVTGDSALADVNAQLSYEDTGLSEGRGYTYRVRALGLSGDSAAWSNEASTVIPVASQTSANMVSPATGSHVSTIGASADAHVRGGTTYQGLNYGDDWGNVVKKSSTTDQIREAFYKFDLGSIDGPVSDVKVRFYAKMNSSDGTRQFDLKAVSNTSWGELTITYSNKPTLGSTLGSFSVSSTSYQWYEVDVTSHIQAALAAGSSTVAFALVGNANSNAYLDVASRDWDNNTPPELQVTSDVPYVTRTATADTYVRNGTSSGSNYGPDVLDLAKLNSSNEERESLHKFDLSGITDKVTNVKLRLYGRLHTADGTKTFNVYTNSVTSWAENTVTWSTKPTKSGSSIGSFSVTNVTDQWYEIDVTSYVQAELAAGRTTLSFNIAGAASSTAYFRSTSKESLLNPAELRISTDLAQGKTTTSSSGSSPSNATDGNAGTKWTASNANGEYLQVDLGETIALTSARIRWDADYASAYKIQVSPTGTNSWTDAYSSTSGTAAVQNITFTGTGRYVRLLGVTRGTANAIAVKDFNLYGHVPTGPAAPAAPSGLSATSVTATAASLATVSLSWTDNASDETGFIVQRKPTSGGAWSTIATPAANATSYSDTTAATDTNYDYQIAATNGGGDSSFVSVTNVATPPTAASGLAITGTTLTSNSLSWTDNSSTETEYRVERRNTGGSTYSTIASGLAANTASYTDTTAVAGTQYDYRVRAIRSSLDGWASAPIQSPPPATGVSATVAASTAVTVTWADNASDETSYEVVYSTSSTFSSGVSTATASANATSKLVTGLAAGTTYYFLVRTKTATSQSLSASAVSATPLGALGVGRTPSGTQNEGTQITLSATYASGTAVSGTTYAWTVLRNGGAFTTGTGASFQFNAVNDGTYTASVVATTPSGVTDSASLSPSLTVVNVAPTLTAAGDSTVTEDTEYTLSLLATDPGTNDTITWNIDWGDGSAVEHPTGRDLDVPHEYATPGPYTITVTAGDGTATNVATSPATISVTVTDAAPAAPASLHTTSVTPTGLTSVTVALAWTDNAGNETGFKLERRESGGSWSQIATPAANATTYSDATAVADKTYEYRVRATNSTGDSAYATVTDVQTPPAAPTGLTVSGTTASSVSLTWADNATTETEYRIERRQTGGTTYSTIASGLAANSTSYTDTTAAEGTQYDYRVRPVRGSSLDGTAAGPVQVWTNLAMPTAVSVESQSTSSITVSWTDQSASETGFVVEYSTSNTFEAGTFASELVDGANEVSTTVTGLSAGTLYYFRVRATNATTTSLSSEVQSTSTESAPVLTAAITDMPTTAAEGQTVTLGSQLENVPEGVTPGYIWRLYKDGALIATARGEAFTFTPAGNGLYQAKLRVTDGSVWAEAIDAVTVDETAPSVGISGRNWATEGEPYVLHLAASDPGQDEITGWNIDWGDGHTETVGNVESVTHVFAALSDGVTAQALQSANAYPSNTRSVQVRPKAPTQLTAVRSSGDVALAWSGLSAVAEHYVVERRIATTSGTWAVIASVGGTESGYVDQTTAPGVDYQYRVKATNAGSSVYSNIAGTAGSPTGDGTVVDLTVTGLHLVSDTGTPADGATTDLRVAGQVAGSGSLGSLAIQIDTNGDGNYEGLVFTDADGAFVFDAADYVAGEGTYVIKVRAGRADPIGGAIAFGTPAVIQITRTPDPTVGGDPQAPVPSASTHAVYSDTTRIKPEIDHIDGSAATKFAGGWVRGGGFTSFAYRFDPAGEESHSSIEQDTDETPITDSWTESGGAYTAETSDTSKHTVNAVVAGDGSWTYTETYTVSTLVETWFAGSDQSDWHRQQAYTWSYTLTANGDADSSEYDVVESKSNGYWFGWSSEAPGLTDDTYVSSANESFTFKAEGQSVTDGGITVTSDSIAYDASGDDLTRTEWEDITSVPNQDEYEGSWTYAVVRTIDNALTLTPELSDYFSFAETRYHTYENTEGYNYDSTTTDGGRTTRTYGQGSSALDGKVKDVYGVDGFYVAPATGGSSSRTRVYHTEKSSYDTLVVTGSDTIETTDTSGPDTTVEASSTANKSMTRERSIDNMNDATTYRSGGVMYAFNRDTDGTMTTTAAWENSNTATSSGEQGQGTNRSSSFDSSRSFSDKGASSYTNASAGTQRIDAGGNNVVHGSTTITAKMDGETAWSNTDSSEGASTDVITGTNSTTTRSENGSASSSDIGAGSYHTFSKIWSTADELGVVEQYSTTTNTSTSSGDLTDDSSSSVGVKTVETPDPYLTRTTESVSTAEEHPTSHYEINTAYTASVSPAENTWYDSYSRTASGDTDSTRADVSTVKQVDTRTTNPTENLSSTTTYNYSQQGESEESNSVVTQFDDGATSWSQHSEQSVSGPTEWSTVTDASSTKLPVAEDGLTQSEVTIAHYEKSANGAGESSSITHAEGDDSGSSNWSSSTSTDEGAYSVNSNSKTTFSYAQTQDVDPETEAAKLTKYKDWYSLDTFSGYGTYETSASAGSTGDSDGAYSSSSKSSSTSSDDGETEFWTDSKAYIKGVEEVDGVTTTYGADEGSEFNEDRYYEHRKGSYTATSSDDASSSSANGKYTSSRTITSEFDNTGESDWLRKESTTVQKEDASVPLVERKSSATSTREDTGTGSYANGNESSITEAFGVKVSSSLATHDNHSGTWTSKTTANTESSYTSNKDLAVLGTVVTGTSIAHDENTGSGTFYAEQQTSDILSKDGTRTIAGEDSSGSVSDGASAFSVFEQRFVDQDVTIDGSPYAYGGPDGKAASAATRQTTKASLSTESKRSGTGWTHDEDYRHTTRSAGTVTEDKIESYSKAGGTFAGYTERNDNAKVSLTAGTSSGGSDLVNDTSTSTIYRYDAETGGEYSSQLDVVTVIDADGKSDVTDYTKYNDSSKFVTDGSDSTKSTGNRLLDARSGTRTQTSRDNSSNSTKTQDGLRTSSSESTVRLFTDGTSTSDSVAQQYEEGNLSNTVTQNQDAITFGAVIDETGEPTQEFTSSVTRSSTHTYAPEKQYTSYGWQHTATSKAGSTTTDTKSGFTKNQKYTFSESETKDTVQYTPHGSADPFEPDSGDVPADESSYTKSTVTRVGTEGWERQADSAQDIGGVVVVHNWSEEASKGKYTDKTETGTLIEENNVLFSSDDKGVHTAGTRSGKSWSKTLYNTIDATFDSKTTTTHDIEDGSDSASETNVNKNAGKTSWATDSGTSGTETSTETYDDTEHFHPATIEKTTNNKSSESGEDTFDLTDSTTTTYIDGGFFLRETHNSGTGSGKSNWDRYQSATLTARREEYRTEEFFKAFAILGVSFPASFVPTRTDSSESLTDYGSAKSSYSYDWTTTEADDGTKTTWGTGTNTLSDIDSTYTSNTLQRSGDITYKQTSTEDPTHTVERMLGGRTVFENKSGKVTGYAWTSLTTDFDGKNTYSGKSEIHDVGSSHSGNQKINWQDETKVISVDSVGAVPDKAWKRHIEDRRGTKVEKTYDMTTIATVASDGTVSSDSDNEGTEISGEDRAFEDVTTEWRRRSEEEPNEYIEVQTFQRGSRFEGTKTDDDFTKAPYERAFGEEQGLSEYPGPPYLGAYNYSSGVLERTTKGDVTYATGDELIWTRHPEFPDGRAPFMYSVSAEATKDAEDKINVSDYEIHHDYYSSPNDYELFTSKLTNGEMLATYESSVYPTYTEVFPIDYDLLDLSLFSDWPSGDYTALNYDFSENANEWFYATTGIDLEEVRDDVVEAYEVATDAVTGFVDGAVEALNPLGAFGLEVPNIGPIYGHDTAYGIGNIAGTVAGVAGSFLIGNVASGASGLVACGSLLQKGAKLYTALDTGIGIAAGAYHLSQGQVGLGDALALAPAAGALFGKVGKKLGILSDHCFVAGTQVMVTDANGSISGVAIENIKPGDLVWSRDENDPNAPLTLKPVTEVYRNVAYDLQLVSLQSADGDVERINATDEHPFYVEGRGWINAADLAVGEHVLQPDGQSFVVLANADDKRPEGVLVFNFAVEDGHTYFVEDGTGERGWAWVHNSCNINLPIDTPKLQHTFKHANDFGITASWSKASGAVFQNALVKHIDSAPTVIKGTYRNTIQVTHYFDQSTGLWASVDLQKNLVAAWKLGPTQVLDLLKNANVK